MCLCPLQPTPIYPLTPPPPPLQTSICGLTTRHRQWREGGTNRKRERTRSFGSPDILHSDSWWRQIRLTHAHNCQTSPAPHPLLNPHPPTPHPQRRHLKNQPEAFLHFSTIPTYPISPPRATPRAALTAQTYLHPPTHPPTLAVTQRDALWHTFSQRKWAVSIAKV